MKTYILHLCSFFILLCFVTQVQAQNDIVKSLESYVPGEGRISIRQDAGIAALIGKSGDLKSSENSNAKMAGYRIQLYSGGNSRNARKEAETYAARARSGFPELKIYTTFNPPRWLCRVGDFLSIEEADAMMRKLRKEGGFREVTIVKDQVNISL